ncbi:MAG: hypothetical protein HRU70_09095 [Phycisphaeraceae bacterium]|nr:MAG: hypothetical protein HRU70_09095 [Phycisphaeraceae bacterium]
MTTGSHAFGERIDRLRADLVDQARRVLTVVEASFEALFGRSPERAAWVFAADDEIDRVDVAIERACVDILDDATEVGARLDAEQVRMLLTIAKINNELERVADAAVDVAELGQRPVSGPYPDTFRVMANSVIGILRDTGTVVARKDPALAKVVLQSQHAVAAFKAAIVRDAEQKIAAGSMTVDFAFTLHELASLCELIADHCTNIAEQVIYATTGAIVRHTADRWEEVQNKKEPLGH